MIGLSNHALFSAATRALLSFFEARPTLRWSVIGLSVNTLVKSPDSSSGVSVTRAVCRRIRYGALGIDELGLVGALNEVRLQVTGKAVGKVWNSKAADWLVTYLRLWDPSSRMFRGIKFAVTDVKSMKW